MDFMSSTGTAAARYTHVAILRHGSIAALILLNLGLGFIMGGLAQPLRSQIVTVQVSSGFTVLALHVPGALKHQWLDRPMELARMGLGRIRSSS